MKVVELIISHLTDGWSPEELHFQYPHIALGKIYSALAYYWDHQILLDADIQRRLSHIEALRQSAPHSLITQKLKDRGVLE